MAAPACSATYLFVPASQHDELNARTGVVLYAMVTVDKHRAIV
jgi:hypothetical protein